MTRDSRFNIPKEWRDQAQKWINAGGDPSRLASALDYDLPPLTETQRKALYDSLEDKRGADYILDDIKRRGDRRSSKYVARRYNSLDRELVASALKGQLSSNTKTNMTLTPEAVFGERKKPNINMALKNLQEANRLQKQKAAAEALRKGFKLIKGGVKFLGPVGAALGTAMDAKDAYALTESTLNPKTDVDLARQKALADLMRRNEFY